MQRSTYINKPPVKFHMWANIGNCPAIVYCRVCREKVLQDVPLISHVLEIGALYGIGP